MADNTDNINIFVKYQLTKDNNITYIKIIAITEDNNKDKDTCIIKYTLDRSILHKYYICRLWSLKVDNKVDDFVCVDYIRKLNYQTTHTLNPEYNIVNILLKYYNIDYEYNIDICYDKVSVNSIVVNSYDNNGLYEPYDESKIYYGLLHKKAYEHNETIIMAFGKDKEKLLKLKEEHNTDEYIIEIPSYYQTAITDNNIYIYGSLSDYDICLEGILITDEILTDNNNDRISCNFIEPYIYYDDGIINA